MTTFQRLLNNSHPALNKDPVPQPSLYFMPTSGGVIVIKDGVLQMTRQSPITLSTYTISSLASHLASLTGFDAQAVVNGNLSALALLDGTYTLTANIALTIPIFTSILWQIMRTLSLELEQLLQQDNESDFQITPQTATGIWLNELGSIYNVPREQDEPDSLYAIRLFDFSLASRINNISIERALNDLGYSATVDDVTPGPAFEVNVQLPTYAPNGFVYSTGSLASLVNQLKAAGVQSTINLQGQLSDTIYISDSISTSTSPAAWTWDSFKWGQFSW